jgi:hypothetical protein
MPSELEGLLPARTAFLDGVGGQLQQDLTGEGVVLRVQRHQACGGVAELHTAGDTRQRHPDRRGPVLGRGSLLLRHQPDRTWAGRHAVGRARHEENRRWEATDRQLRALIVGRMVVLEVPTKALLGVTPCCVRR